MFTWQLRAALWLAIEVFQSQEDLEATSPENSYTLAICQPMVYYSLLVSLIVWPILPTFVMAMLAILIIGEVNH